MKNFYEKTLEKLSVFFNSNIKSYDEIFLALKELINFKEGVIYFLTPENLRVQAFYNTETPINIQISENEKTNLFNPNECIDTKIFSSESFLVARLITSGNIFGILQIKRDNSDKFSNEEIKVFEFCSPIISSLIKDIELTDIIKMQTKALQDGLIETEKAYKIIKTQNKKIVAADKVKNQFLTNVSHELRTPLNSIIGFSELLQNPMLGNLNEKQTEFVKDIQTASIHLLGMINEILDISKLESHSMKLNFREFQLQLCINETLNILKPLYEKKNISIIKELEDTVITADYNKIQQIFFNIINNAIKFTPEDGKIEIFTIIKRKSVEIHIKDNGCGIDKKFHKKIFQKFEQIQETQNSTGLGLTITKELVKLHKGKITLISELGQGSEFIIQIPKL